MIHSIILWIYTQRIKFTTTLRMLYMAIYFAYVRFMWNVVISPAYFRWESFIINLIENGKIDQREYLTPTRLMYYAPPEVHLEDRYDYEHLDR